ncbi:prolyl 3-hydroxylase OGFOD1-like [Dreissena polymorpha]|uniref:prolyl 3-hydroxylase OGFOD1-like n=1 Tax=Dreissena polymorpha TaxID=45954 RepID=UPI002263B6FA|nr:prolyl 3-hydroxylase OGFOD1-like [Dreissena polymorpha]
MSDLGSSKPKMQKLEIQSAESETKLTLRDSILSCSEIIAKSWPKEEGFVHEASRVELYQKPFRHCVIPDLIKDEELLETLQEELFALEFTPKNNDLYKFLQTITDLKSCKSSIIKDFRKLLCVEIRDWLKCVTGIPLNDTVDAFCAQYKHTDTLLCHDDELEGRRIAYIYYLVDDDWSEKDGGALHLYSVDENIQPKDVVKSIVPVRNNFVFFEVSPGSYHQVAEVLSESKTRLSIAGWFHGPPIKRPKPFIEPALPLAAYGNIEDDVFFDWINPVYLGPATQGSIQEKFENDSEIELQDFLVKDKYDALMKALSSSDVTWKMMAPANKRCYRQADESSLPDPVQTCLRLLRSDAMFLLLSNLTGLRLHELAAASSDSEGEEDGIEEGEEEQGGASCSKTNKNEKDKSEDKLCASRCRSEVRHWSPGSYTLVHDTNTEGAEFALDLVLYVGCNDWDMEYGGFTSYIAKGEDEELLTVTPQENSLALVYRDQDTLKFVKYLNCGAEKMPNKGFYDISAVYYE